METKTCPICGYPKAKDWGARQINDPEKIYTEFECVRCKKFSISVSLEATIQYRPPAERIILCGYVRYLNESGMRPPMLNNYNYQNTIKGIDAPKTVLDKIERTILYLGHKSGSVLGTPVKIEFHEDYPIAFCANRQELEELINNYLQKADLIADLPTQSGKLCKLTVSGWERYYDLQKKHITSKQCFVAMSFNDALDKVFTDGIKPAAEKMNFSALRLKETHHNGMIDDKIIFEIRRSRFLIADFTGLRGGVYYEAGYARALGREVIFTCEDKDAWRKDLHFDIEHMNFIFWKDIEDLKNKLMDRIGATIIPAVEAPAIFRGSSMCP